MSSPLHWSSGIVLAFLLLQMALLSAAHRRTERLFELYPRIVFSRSMLKHPEVDPAFVFDHDLSTAWWDQKQDQDESSSVAPEPIPPYQMHYIMFEMAPSHFPDQPPRTNKLQSLIIYSGWQKEGHFYDYARPRTIELIFFSQQLVDPDREFRFPGAPVFVYRKKVQLLDTAQAQEILLNELPPPPDSPAFPIGVSQYWLRIEFLDHYPGKTHPDRVAISEIDFQEEHPTHRNFTR